MSMTWQHHPAGPHGSGRGPGQKAGVGTAGDHAASTLSAGMRSSCPRQRSGTHSGAASRGGEEMLGLSSPVTCAAVTRGARGCQRTFRRARSSLKRNPRGNTMRKKAWVEGRGVVLVGCVR